MGSNWKIVKLNEITSKITKGTTPSKKDGGFSNTGINYIKAEAVSYEGRIDSSSFVFITPEIHDKLKRSKLEKDDILFSMAGAYLGKTGIVKAEYLPANTNQALALIRPIKDLVVPNYLHLYLRQKSVVHFVNNATSQSAQPNINLQDIGNLKIRLPDLDTQKSIAKVLGDLDDKIELNNQTNQTLEQMAQALFKSWFVDFDPVFDNLLASVDFKLENLENQLPDELKQKAQRRLAALNSLHNAADVKTSLSALAHELQALSATQAAVQAAETPVKANLNANPNILAQHANTHAHFPNEFEHNEQLGWIPKGWEVESIYESIDIVYGAPFKSKQFNNDAIGYPIIRIRDLKTGSPQNWSDELHPKRTLIKAGDIVVGMDAEFRATVWSGEDGFLNQRLFLAKGRKKYISNLFIKYSLAPLLAFQEHTQVGTTVAHLGKKEIDRFEILMPSNSILKQSSDFFEDIKDKIVQNYKSTTQLTKLRDTLLPKLISGELQIPDVATDE